MILALAEPMSTAALLAVFGILLGISVLFSRAMERLGVPIVLLFMILGMLAGSEGIGGIAFDNYAMAFRIGVVALILILFDGGLSTSLDTIRQSIKPAGVLATLGVVGTAAAVAIFAWALGLPLPAAMLLGAIVSSTDAATVFAVLRGSNLRLRRRIGTTLELESGLNDPMAVILTAALVQYVLNQGAPGSGGAGAGGAGWGGLGWGLALLVPYQLAVGFAVGAAAGFGGRSLIRRVRLTAGGLYPVLTLAIAFLAFGAATLANASGFLAVYAAAVIIGNGAIPYRSGLIRTHDAIAWLSQITMFLMLGLLVYPSRLIPEAGIGLAIGLFLAFVARPLVVALCLAPFRYPAKEVGYIGWVGLRGAVPIILATFPLIANVPGADRLFHLVFFIVVVNALVPGATIRAITRRLGFETPEVPAPAAILEINSTRLLQGDLKSFFIDDTLAVCGAAVSQIRFPANAAAILLVRGDELIAPRGDTVLNPGDHVYIFYNPEDRAFIELMFGRPQEGGAPGEA